MCVSHTCYLVASDAESALHKSLTYRDPRRAGDLGTHMGRRRYRRCIAEALWTTSGSASKRSASIVVAAPVAALLRFIRRRP